MLHEKAIECAVIQMVETKVLIVVWLSMSCEVVVCARALLLPV